MASVQFTDVQARLSEFLDLTSLTLDEFQHLVPPFEAAFQAHMAAWRLDGKPRTARQFTVDIIGFKCCHRSSVNQKLAAGDDKKRGDCASRMQSPSRDPRCLLWSGARHL